MLKNHKDSEAAAKYNSPNIESFEAMEGEMAYVKGAAAVKAKSDWWLDNHEVHSVKVEGPYPNGNIFVVKFEMDVTYKPANQRIQMSEVGIYTIENGKIVSERFCYLM